MTRKITLSIVLILLLYGCYELAFGTQPVIREKIASIRELESASKKLETASLELEKQSTTNYENKKTELKKVIENYNQTKDEYETILPPTVTDPTDTLVANELKDIYDVDFLWTIVGNYATEEGIDLKFDINKNYTSADSINNTSSNYVVCDLKFVITGQYINLTDFIYDIEDDDRLNFEINDFTMRKVSTSDEKTASTNVLEVTLNVRNIKVNSNNLIEFTSSSQQTTSTIQNINSTTSNTANNTTSTNTTNSTNTSNTTTSNNVN